MKSDFLDAFISLNKPNIVSYDQIQYHVWGDNIMSDSSLTDFGKKLKKKVTKGYDC